MKTANYDRTTITLYTISDYLLLMITIYYAFFTSFGFLCSVRRFRYLRIKSENDGEIYEKNKARHKINLNPSVNEAIIILNITTKQVFFPMSNSLRFLFILFY